MKPRVLFDVLEFEFTLPPCHKRYVCWASDGPWHLAPGYTRAEGLIDDSGDEDHPWFVCFIADCFDPPLYMVRAASWEDAIAAFDEEHNPTDPTDPEDESTSQCYAAKLVKGCNK